MVNIIVIFGSTGSTGICATSAAVDKGMLTRAFVRDPNRMPEQLRGKVEFYKGDVLKYEDVLKAVKNSDAVVCTLGVKDTTPTTVMSSGLSNILKAMKAASVSIISVCLSAFLFFDINSQAVPKHVKEITKDHQRMYDMLVDSGLNYIAAFPPHITQSSPTGYIWAYDRYLSKKISKWDLGQFLVDSLEMPEHFGKVVGLGSK